MKTCFKCKTEKPLDDFYRHPMMADGHLNKCKDCAKVDIRTNRRRNFEYYREYDRKRGNRQPPEYVAEYRLRSPEKNQARTAVANAVRDGKIRKEPCFFCGAEKVVGHHVDYTKPLDVVWLCQPCHKRIHAYEDLAQSIRTMERATSRQDL